MKYLVSLLFLLVASVAYAEHRFTVTDRCDASTQFTVTNRMIPEAKFSLKRIFAFRNPVGHTHTCANGHTWDHSANPTHKCQFCGQIQVVVDPTPRKVTVEKVIQVPVTETAPASQSFNHSWDHFVQGVSSSGGCANGRCAVPQSAKSRLFGR